MTEQLAAMRDALEQARACLAAVLSDVYDAALHERVRTAEAAISTLLAEAPTTERFTLAERVAIGELLILAGFCVEAIENSTRSGNGAAVTCNRALATIVTTRAAALMRGDVEPNEMAEADILAFHRHVRRDGSAMTLRRRLHRLRFNLWLLGAADFDGFTWRAHVLARMRRGLLGVRPTLARRKRSP